VISLFCFNAIDLIGLYKRTLILYIQGKI